VGDNMPRPQGMNHIIPQPRAAWIPEPGSSPKGVPKPWGPVPGPNMKGHIGPKRIHP
jgi:hypothetical protein